MHRVSSSPRHFLHARRAIHGPGGLFFSRAPGLLPGSPAARPIYPWPVSPLPGFANEDWSMAHAKAEDSPKLAYLEELLDEVVAGEHRALLFCRSTQMHQILERFLEEWGIKYLQLDGSTPTDQRQRLVDQFNSSPDITVFLLSMAGSSGINLASADTVIFSDHDWNPANDAQAMDRAYRIGQKKDVTVYRLVSRGTIEERILERQRSKQSLADEVIGADAAGFKDLTKEELMGLFQLDSGHQNGL